MTVSTAPALPAGSLRPKVPVRSNGSLPHESCRSIGARIPREPTILLAHQLHDTPLIEVIFVNVRVPAPCGTLLGNPFADW